MTRISCHRFRANEVWLWLSVIAYNLGNLWQRLVLPLRVGNCSLTSLQQRLVKTGGRLIKHARYWLLLAEGHLTRRLFGAMVRRIEALALPTGWPGPRREANLIERHGGGGEVSQKSPPAARFSVPEALGVAEAPRTSHGESQASRKESCGA